MCFAQISFPIDVVHITKIGPLVLIQIHVLRFWFNSKLNKSRQLLEGEEKPSPVEPRQPSWNHCGWGLSPTGLQRLHAELLCWSGWNGGPEAPGHVQGPQRWVTGHNSPICPFLLHFEETLHPWCVLLHKLGRVFNRGNVTSVYGYNIKPHPRVYIAIKTTAPRVARLCC